MYEFVSRIDRGIAIVDRRNFMCFLQLPYTGPVLIEEAEVILQCTASTKDGFSCVQQRQWEMSQGLADLACGLECLLRPRQWLLRGSQKELYWIMLRKFTEMIETRSHVALRLEGRVSCRNENDTIVTTRKEVLDRIFQVINVIDDEQPWLLLAEAREPALCGAFIEFDLPNSCNCCERVLSMLDRACINPKNSPETVTKHKLQSYLDWASGRISVCCLKQICSKIVFSLSLKADGSRIFSVLVLGHLSWNLGGSPSNSLIQQLDRFREC